MQINEERLGRRAQKQDFFFVPHGFAARPSLVLSIYCGLKEEQETARSLRSLVTASLVNDKGRHVMHPHERIGKNMSGLC